MSLSIIKYPSGGGGGGTDMAIGGMVLGGTEGSVLFIGTAGVLAEDNPNFFYDNTNNTLALGHNTPDARFHIHDVVFDNYLTITRPDTVIASDPGGPAVTVRYNLTQTDGNWAGDAVTEQGLRLECVSIYDGADPVPGLFQVAMPTHIDADPSNFDTALNVTGFIGANISGQDTGIVVSSDQLAINITAPGAIGIQFGAANTGISASIGNLNTLFSVTCNDGGNITATAGTGLTLEAYGGPGLSSTTYVAAQPAIFGLKASTTGTNIDPVATFRGTTNFVVQNNSGLYLNLQPALPASQISDALRMTAKWTNIASPTSEIQFAGRNANVDTQILTIQSNANGRVGIGSTVTAPTARLHLPAGSATAQTGPLKFTSGTNLTTAEAGVFEYNGTSLFFSPSTTRLRTVLTDNSIPTNGQLPIGNGVNYTNATITGGSGITVTNGVGSITLSTNAIRASGVLNFPSTAGGTTSDLTLAVVGAVDGDPVILGVPNAAVLPNSNYTAWVSAADVVTVRFTNDDVTSQDPPSGTFRVVVFKP